jgi:hypothetical protein
MKYIALIAALSLCFAAPSSDAKYAMPQIKKVPLKRLLNNLEKQLKESKSGKGTLNLELARLHAMAYSLKLKPESEVDTTFENRVMSFWRGHEPFEAHHPSQKPADPGNEAEAKDHLKKAIAHYETVMKTESDYKNRLARIGLGWCLIEAGEKDKARNLLRESFQQAKLKTENAKSRLSHADAEMIEYLLPLLDPENDAAEIKVLKETEEEIKKSPRMITPLMFTFRGTDQPLKDLILKNRGVEFDLDGLGSKSWQWIGKNAAWLVYASDNERIESGLQLFGSVTFWIFWDHGFAPLAALDDDFDGRLSGSELEKIAVWNDANENGVSEPGEIHSLKSRGIESLSTSYRTDRDGILTSACGIRHHDGTCRRVYDFVARPMSR